MYAYMHITMYTCMCTYIYIYTSTQINIHADGVQAQDLKNPEMT